MQKKKKKKNWEGTNAIFFGGFRITVRYKENNFIQEP